MKSKHLNYSINYKHNIIYIIFIYLHILNINYKKKIKKL